MRCDGWLVGVWQNEWCRVTFKKLTAIFFEAGWWKVLPVGLGVERSLGEEDGVLLGGDTELVVEGVVLQEGKD